MPDSFLEALRRQLEAESSSPSVLKLHKDFFSNLATYSRKLARSKGSGASDATIHLVEVQQRLIGSMIRELVVLRFRKATLARSTSSLLPEEKFVYVTLAKSQRRLESFIASISIGQSSFIDNAREAEAERIIVMKFSKHLDELIGPDLTHYGPFEPEDVAALPAPVAEILISTGSGSEIVEREEI